MLLLLLVRGCPIPSNVGRQVSPAQQECPWSLLWSSNHLLPVFHPDQHFMKCFLLCAERSKVVNGQVSSCDNLGLRTMQNGLERERQLLNLMT